MPVPPELLRTEFIVVDPDSSVLEVLTLVMEKDDMWIHIVVSFGNGQYAVLRLREIFRALAKLEDQSKSGGLARPPDYSTLRISSLVLFKSEGLDEATTTRTESKKLMRAAPLGRIAVLSGNTVIGVLDEYVRSAIVDDVGETLSVFWAKRRSYLPNVPATSQGAAPRHEEDSELRWINAEILDHDLHVPLQVGQLYTLAFDVDKEVRLNSLAKDAAFTYRFTDEEESVELTVQLSSPDFRIHTEPQKLKIPRSGRSKNKARFDIEPEKEGEGVISAVFLKDGNFIQLLTLKLNVGSTKEITSESLSRPLEAAFAVQPRDLGMVIMNTGTNFRLIMTGSVCAEATIPITTAELDQMISRTREALRELVTLKVGKKQTLVYQSLLDIPEQVNRSALRHLAESGYLLFQQIFFGDAADAQARLLGERLIALSEKQQLKIQIVSQQFLLPWGLLYLAPRFDPDQIEPERFLGFKHIIEHLPLQPSMQVLDSIINSKPKLTVSLNLDREIDRDTGHKLTEEQLDYWGKQAQQWSADVLVRETAASVVEALADAENADQLIYFYCHAAAKDLNEVGGPDASCFKFPGGALTLKDLKLRAPTRTPLTGAPLVFINACESAEMSPLFYDGFVPYFMSKGARGVVGTECEIPALFARQWATSFFDRFLSGRPLGEIFLELRREFLFKHNNPLGLLYAVYCDGDTRISPAVV